jgi:hypothetical protein
MTIAATLRKRDKLAAQLTWLANRQMPEDRRHDRFAPKQCHGAIGAAKRHQCGLPRDRSFAVRRVVVTIGKTQGRVVRHIEHGFAIEFMRLQHPDFVEDNEPANNVTVNSALAFSANNSTGVGLLAAIPPVLAGRSTVNGCPETRVRQYFFTFKDTI